jgi:uncharacterized protein HemX
LNRYTFAGAASRASRGTCICHKHVAHDCNLACRNQRKKKALAETNDAYNQLLSDNQVLLQQLEDTNREAYHAAEHFRQEVLGKSQKIAELQTQLEQVWHGDWQAAESNRHMQLCTNDAVPVL